MKTVLVTGASRGIGKALAQKFLAEGYFVIGASLNGIDFAHDNLRIVRLDLSDGQSIAACAAEIENIGKPISIHVNNAGALFDEDDTTVIADKLRQTLEVNVIGTADFTERIVPLLDTDAHIVNISSTAGSLSLAGHESHYEGHYPAYKISKAALNMYMRTLALRLKGKATVSSVHPGWVRTDMGGPEADIEPEEAAEHIYELAISRPETGQFWFNGKQLPW